MKNYSLNYGDNAECDVCYSVFDTQNSQYEIVSDNWVCDRCLDRDNEELAEMADRKLIMVDGLMVDSL